MSLHRGRAIASWCVDLPSGFARSSRPCGPLSPRCLRRQPVSNSARFSAASISPAPCGRRSTSRASERVASRFGLQLRAGTAAAVYSEWLLPQGCSPRSSLLRSAIGAAIHQPQQTAFALRHVLGGVVLLSALMAASDLLVLHGQPATGGHVQAPILIRSQAGTGRSG